MAAHACPQPTKMTKSIKSFHRYLTVCKVLRHSLIYFQRYWQFAILEHFGSVITCLTTTNKNDKVSLQLPLMSECMKNIQTITQLFKDLLAFEIYRHLSSIFVQAWTCLNTHNKNYKFNLKFPLMSDCMKTVQTIIQLFPEILAICYFEALQTCLGMSDYNQVK